MRGEKMKKGKILVGLLLSICLLFLSCNNKRTTPLELALFSKAIEENDVEYVKNEIKKNKNILYVGIEAVEGEVLYPIHQALWDSTDDEIVELLAKKGTVNCVLHGVAPLELAIMKNRSNEVLQILIDNGADIYKKDLNINTNIFHTFAQYNRNYETWKFLSKYATKEMLNEETELGDHNTPIVTLVYEQVEGDIDSAPENTAILLKEFIEKGANPNIFIYYEDFIINVVEVLNEYGFDEYKKVILDGMRKSEPIGNSLELLEKLEQL